MIIRKEEVELVMEWLELKLDEVVDTHFIGYSEEELKDIEYDEFMIRAALEVVGSVLNEM